MTSLRRIIRLAARRGGIDLVPFPQSDPIWQTVRLQREHRVDVVIDVGANDGGYGGEIRQHGFAGRLISFEPLTEPFKLLRAKTAFDDGWDAMRLAIGAQAGEVTINVAGNNGASSSLLPMLERHREAAPDAVFVGTETAEMRLLDEVLPAMGVSPEAKIFLKMDVQGFEHSVLDGAARLLESGVVVGLQMELSFAPLYEGAMTWREGIDRAESYGMALHRLDPGFTAPNGRTLQADGVFFKSK